MAAVNGHALGGGWALAQRCDLRLAAETAEFAITEIRYGLPVSIFATELVRLVPPAIAMDLLLLGRPLSARRAYEIGFLNAVVPAERLLDEALAWAEAIAQAPVETAAADKELLMRSLLPDRPALRVMADEIAADIRRVHVRNLRGPLG